MTDCAIYGLHNVVDWKVIIVAWFVLLIIMGFIISRVKSSNKEK